MSCINKISPVGIDAYIDRLQTKMYAQLTKKWSTTDATYNCYPRVYRNQDKTNGYVAQPYLGNNEYGTDVYLDDTISVTSFFGMTIDESVTADEINNTGVHLIFFVDLSKIKPGTNRNDLEARNDVQKIISSYGASRGFLLNKVSTGIDNILKEYNGTKLTVLKSNFSDMQPYHCFRFDMTLINYTPTLEECGSD